MAQLKITQVKSVIDRSEKQKRTMQALGLTGVNKSVVHEANPQIIGMIEKVLHLVKLENN